MSIDAIDLRIVAIGVLCNVSCALLGSYLVLRRMSLLGDAISHAVLPGIVVAFVVFQNRAPLPMFLGAMAVGVLTAFLTQTVHRVAGVSEDTSMGVVFTTLFALGVVLIRVVPGTDRVDLDPGCVFEGNIELEALDVVHGVPRSAIVLGIVLLANLAFITLLWKELALAAFDAALSSSLGFSAGLIYYLLMAMVAGTTVVSFWSVGSILVIAMLIVPGAAAHLLTDRLAALLWIAAGIGALSAVLGYSLARALDTNTAGMMAVVAGAQYGLAMFLAPRHGIVVRWARRVRMTLRIAREDILAAIYRLEEGDAGATLAVEDALRLAPAPLVGRVALWALRLRGQVLLVREGRLALGEGGRLRAARLVRSHRLWESYLAEHVGLASDRLHEPAMRMEHFVTAEIERELVTRLADTRTDPHGRPIPARRSEAAGEGSGDAERPGAPGG